VVFSIVWLLNSPGCSLNPNDVIVPQCGPGEKSFLRGPSLWANGGRLIGRKKRPPEGGLYGIVRNVERAERNLI
jgi:hypothetical protein